MYTDGRPLGVSGDEKCDHKRSRDATNARDTGDLPSQRSYPEIAEDRQCSMGHSIFPSLGRLPY